MLTHSDTLAGETGQDGSQGIAVAWRDYFLEWPAELPRRGVAVTSYDEQIPFDGFLTSDRMVLLERRTPDTLGARKVILPYVNIQAIKIVDPVKTKIFHKAGFEGGVTPAK